tara:strand:- start:724 stop:1392 length:669 start_codon:yes stop_codon:yes gene_type:complete
MYNQIVINNDKINEMQIVQMNIGSIKPYEKNPRKIPTKAINFVKESLKNFGWQQPIVVDEEKVIVVGHTRYEAAKSLDMKEVPVQIAKLTTEQAKAYRIADNKVNELTEWDNVLLNNELLELQNMNIDLSNIGFDEKEIENIFDIEAPEFTVPENSFEEEVKNIDDIQNSNVRMVQLFLNNETEIEFKKMTKELSKKYNISNITDVVYKAVQNEYNRSKTNT